MSENERGKVEIRRRNVRERERQSTDQEEVLGPRYDCGMII
jgi:hypothetical protein